MFQKSIIILGSGYIGTHLYHYLTGQPNYITSGDAVIKVNRKTLDYSNSSALTTFLKEIADVTCGKIIVINCAGFTGRPNVDACEQQENKSPCWDLNAVLPMKIGNVCKSLNMPFIHISSGCIYNGYDTEYSEDDEPNFGLMSNISSFYSKTKHAGELNLKAIDYGKVIRLRMPFCSDLKNPRNLLFKIKKYNRLISMENSLTCVEDLCEFIQKYINTIKSDNFEIFNVVNEGTSTAKAISIMMNNSGEREFCDESSLNLAAKRSNTVLSTKKIKALGLQLPNVNKSLIKCLAQTIK